MFTYHHTTSPFTRHHEELDTLDECLRKAGSHLESKQGWPTKVVEGGNIILQGQELIDAAWASIGKITPETAIRAVPLFVEESADPVMTVYVRG